MLFEILRVHLLREAWSECSLRLTLKFLNLILLKVLNMELISAVPLSPLIFLAKVDGHDFLLRHAHITLRIISFEIRDTLSNILFKARAGLLLRSLH